MKKSLNVELHIPLKYEEIFDENLPGNRLDLVSKISKKYVLGLLSMINNHPDKILTDNSLEWKTQMKILYQLCTPNDKLFFKLNTKIKKYLGTRVLFNRLANLVAIDEIIRNPQDTNPQNEEIDTENFIKYYLAINSLLREKMDEDIKGCDNSIQEIFISTAPYNEYNAPFYPELDVLRGFYLNQFLFNHPKLGELFKKHFEKIGVNHIEYCISIMLYVRLVLNKGENEVPLFKPDSIKNTAFLDSLSDNEGNDKNILEVLNLKQNIFFKFDDHDKYLLLDIPLLVDYFYYSTINSFWFNSVKKNDFDATYYFGEIGQFYENYICNILKKSFSHFNQHSCKYLDDLKVKIRKKEKELLDFYIRDNQNILLGEVKSSNFATSSKYAKPILDFFREKSNKEKFVDKFGLNQIAESIFFLQELKKEQEAKNDPVAQLILAMLVVQAQAEVAEPMFGGYILGRNWHFVVLDGRSYAISEAYSATDKEEISDICKVLKGLKSRIDAQIL